MSQTNHIERVAIVGANGRLGKAFTEELLKTGKHTVTALTRAGGKSSFSEGVKVAEVDYADEASLVAALQGQQFLAITLSASAPPETHTNLVKAAVKAGVPYIMPNAYGSDFTREGLLKDDIYTRSCRDKAQEIQDLGAASISMVCGNWYEWSLALDVFFGINLATKKVRRFDDGKTMINTTTWAQCGRALAALLSLPESGASPSVSDWKNKPLYVSSFRVNQRDILDSVNRVKGTSDKDWEITYEPSEKIYQEGMAALQKGDRSGFAQAMGARGFFPTGDSDYETNQGLANEVLGLPKEDMDESSKAAIEMVESGWNPWA